MEKQNELSVLLLEERAKIAELQANDSKLCYLLKPLPEVNGLRNEILEEYFIYLDFVFLQLLGSPETKTAKMKEILLSKSQGELFSFLYNLLLNESDISWDQLKKKILTRFGNGGTDRMALIELSHIKQFPHENIYSFFERVEKLGRKAYPTGIENPENQKKLVDAIVSGLIDESLARKLFKDGQVLTIDKCRQIVGKRVQENQSFNLLRKPYNALQSASFNSFVSPPLQGRIEEPMELSELLGKLSLEKKENNEKLNEEKIEEKERAIEQNEKYDELRKKLEEIQKEMNNEKFADLNSAIEEINDKLKFHKSSREKERSRVVNDKPVREPIRQRDMQERRNFDQKSFVDGRRERGNFQSSKRVTPIKCYNCGKLGHMSRECRSRPSKNFERNREKGNYSAKNSPRKTSPYNKKEITCYKCGGKNHFSSSCQSN